MHAHSTLTGTGLWWLKGFAALYVVALPLAHAMFDQGYVWEIALFFLVAMLFTYPYAAWRQGRHFELELSVSAGLALIGVVGYFTTPWLIILAIAAHGVWDISKHRNVGVPFFSWYTLGCAGVDITYASVLTLHHLRDIT